MVDYIAGYRQNIESGRLCLQYCNSCRKFIFYPRSVCPHCLQSELKWREVCGHGRIYSYTVVYISALPGFKDEIPYIYALVELAEGVRMPSNLIGCPLDEVRVGMPVELTFIERNGRMLPVFKPGKMIPAAWPLFESINEGCTDLKLNENRS